MNEESFQAIFEDYCMIFDIVQKFASNYPTDVNVWKGSTSERVQYMLNKILDLEEEVEKYRSYSKELEGDIESLEDEISYYENNEVS